jgi:hypothetical protein
MTDFPDTDELPIGKWVTIHTQWPYVHEVLRLAKDHNVYRQRYMMMDELMRQNEIDRRANAGKRWGDGQVVGRVPMNLYYSSGLAEANRQRDKGFVKRFWENSDHKKFRTFEGKGGGI